VGVGKGKFSLLKMGFLKEEKGQATVKKVIVVAATLFVGILVIFSLYEGTIQKDIINETLGEATRNTLTYLTTDNAPIATTGIEVRNSTGAVLTEQAIAPGWQLISASTGNISINYTGVDNVINEYLGDALNNTITYLTTDYAPILSTDIEVRNSTGGVITEQAIAPGWQLISASTGNISINYTGIDIGAASDATYIDYTKDLGTSDTTYIDYTHTKITGSALTTAKDTYSYMWTGLLFIGLGLLVIGAMYILGMIGGIGGGRR
jgi:hypothetical protein